ncbi:MAG: pyridoxal phosphate-dependent aminotransferase [Candidatus Liptonbacteria bacterium]
MDYKNNLRAALAAMNEKSSFAMAKKARALEAEGKKVVHFEIGQPDFETPAHIKEAAVRALSDGKTKYVASLGITELREAIAANITKTRGVETSPDEVVVTPSGKTAMLMAMALLITPGDEVIYPDPGFPSYRNIIVLFGGVPKALPLLEKNNFRPDPQDLEKLVSPKTKLIILNSPGNPNGTMLSRGDLEEIAKIIAPTNAYILSDEIYSAITYDAPHESILSIPGMKERTLLLDGFSKAYAMTGWRLGYLIAPREFMPAMDLLAVNMFGSTAAFTQYAGVAALTGPQNEVQAMVKEFKARRDLVVQGLAAIPNITCATPQGAFYAFPNISAFGLSSDEFATRLLAEAGVSLLSGDTYGEYGEGFIRISYATSRAELELGLLRLAEFTAKLNGH